MLPTPISSVWGYSQVAEAVADFGGRGGRGGGGGGGVYLRGAQVGADNDPSSGTRPSTTVATQDLVYFTAISDAYKRITGIENVPVHRTPEGAFFQYGYFQYGVPSFSTLGWGFSAEEAGARGPRGPVADSPEEPSGVDPGGVGVRTASGREYASRRWAVGWPEADKSVRSPGGVEVRGPAGGSGSDAQSYTGLETAGIEGFVDWTTFQHPELGAVEIGGFLPYATTNPPAEQLPELGAKHGEFLVELAGMLPNVRIADTEVTAHGGGIFTVTVEVENTGFLPTSLQHGSRSRSVGPTFVQIQVDEDAILSGAEKTTVGRGPGGIGNQGESHLGDSREGREPSWKSSFTLRSPDVTPQP